MIDADFYVPYEGGHLPMGIVKVTEQTSPDGELKEVRMVIEAVSIGAPIFGDASIRPTRELRS